MANGPFYERGRYLCEITQQALTKAKTGTVQFVLRFNVLQCLTPESDVTQYERTAYLPITPNTMQYVVPKLQSIGYTRDGVRFLDPENPNHHSFIGQEVEMFCQHDAGNDGVIREKWDIAKQSRESKPIDVTPVDSAALRQLDMLFGKHAKTSRPSTSASQAPPSRPPAQASDQGITDDDVPF